MLYEMATGDVPFRGQTGFELTAAILEKPVPPLPARVPEELRGIVQRCLAKDPVERYRHAGEMRAALEGIRPGRVQQRGSWIAAAALLVLLALGAIVFEPRLLSRRVVPTSARSSSVAPVAIRRSIAVLALRNLSGRADAAWLSTALAEMLTTELAAGEKLRAISGESVARTKSDVGINTNLPHPFIDRHTGDEITLAPAQHLTCLSPDAE
jgi:serine/threonine protein kinase